MKSFLLAILAILIMSCSESSDEVTFNPPIESAPMIDSTIMDGLEPYHNRIMQREYDPNDTVPYTQVEENFSNLWYYYSAALSNAGDPFGFFYLVEEDLEAFREIGAVRTVEAFHKLYPLWVEYKNLPYEQQGEFWHETFEKRKPIEDTVEDMDEFGKLLLAYARKNDNQFRQLNPNFEQLRREKLKIDFSKIDIKKLVEERKISK